MSTSPTMAKSETEHGTTFPSAFEKNLNAGITSAPPEEFYPKATDPTPAYPAPRWQAPWRTGLRLPIPVLILLLGLLLLETAIIAFYTAVALYATLPAVHINTNNAAYASAPVPAATATVTATMTTVITFTQTSIETTTTSVDRNVTVTVTTEASSTMTPTLLFTTVDSVVVVPASSSSA